MANNKKELAISQILKADSSYRAEVFNLSGKQLFDSGPVMGQALDWNMSTETGERVAHGVYLPSAQFLSDIALQDLTPKLPGMIMIQVTLR